MSFFVTASNKYGPIKLQRPTAKAAFELATTYRAKGYEDICVTNVETGETFSEIEMADHQLPAEKSAKS